MKLRRARYDVPKPPSEGGPGQPIRVSELSVVVADGPDNRWILADVELAVSAGEFVAVMGPSGAGKSTLLRVIGGDLVPSLGTVEVGERRIDATDRDALAALRRDVIGVVEQDHNLIDVLSVFDNVALPLELAGRTDRETAVAVTRALDAVGLHPDPAAAADTLSGGERQLVAVARAIVGRRSVLLADEPTAALDSLTGERVVRLLRRLADEGRTIVMATHDAALASWADRIVRLRDGRIDTASGPITQVSMPDGVGSDHGLDPEPA